MNTETGTGKVINSPGFGGKEKEEEKRSSPLTPLREKGKGKEDRRGSFRTVFRARLREALDADLDIAVKAFRGTASDRRIWASIAWRVGVEAFHYALADKLKENAADETVLLTPAAAFQAFLNERFPKPEKKGSPSVARSAKEGGRA